MIKFIPLLAFFYTLSHVITFTSNESVHNVLPLMLINSNVPSSQWINKDYRSNQNKKCKFNTENIEIYILPENDKAIKADSNIKELNQTEAKEQFTKFFQKNNRTPEGYDRKTCNKNFAIKSEIGNQKKEQSKFRKRQDKKLAKKKINKISLDLTTIEKYKITDDLKKESEKNAAHKAFLLSNQAQRHARELTAIKQPCLCTIM